ncbi:MAG: DUF4276 family protein [Dehalococcoidia bacterium]|nr:MAG: DUF4276 family protein [Dehalococcoidia bacterium]
MKRIAIFTEGQTELIFIRHFLLKVLDPSKLSFECYELISHQPFTVPYRYPNPSAEIHFLILNVHGDEGVLSSIKEREKKMVEGSGYDRIIGLRDMYCYEYVKRSPGVINDEISNLIIHRQNQIVRDMKHSDRIKLFFAIMEIEAWFLGMYNLFKKIDSVLTVEHIKQKLGIDLTTTDPQKQFYKPSDQVNDIFQLCGCEYKKKRDEIESICSNMDYSDFDTTRENNRCSCFDDFRQEITRCS